MTTPTHDDPAALVARAKERSHEIAHAQRLTADLLFDLAAALEAAQAREGRLRSALQHLTTVIIASVVEEETSTHMAVSFHENDAATILRLAQHARAALGDTP